MVSTDALTSLLRRRAAALALSPDDFARAEEAVRNAGMRLPGATETLRKEWLNDLVASKDGAEFRAAARDPGGHFLRWVSDRAKDRFRVSWRAVEAVSQRIGQEAAARFAVVVWPQEIAWAQRTRLSDNPMSATKAAMFLREAEGNPSKVFTGLSDIYADQALKASYSESPVHESSPDEIRFADDIQDFSPLFLRYAARAYAEILHTMPREKIEALGARAAREEEADRRRIRSASAALRARRFPMRRILTVIASATSMGLSPNEVYLLEDAFLSALDAGEIGTEPGNSVPHAEFIACISDPEARALLGASVPCPEPVPSETLWEVANLDLRWIETHPASWGERWSLPARRAAFLAWQEEVVNEARETPLDPMSDFGFFLMGRP